MKLAAIYNVWDGVELLRGSMDCLKGHVDVFILVYQDVSNFGESYNPIPEMDLTGFDFILVKFTPEVYVGGPNEKKKRNLGLDFARELGCTHFLHMDCDEYYDNFAEAKQLYIDSGKSGSVCKILTYFKSPIYRFENPDNYYVPFIHRLNQNTIAGMQSYPFYVDPTRRINDMEIIEMPVFMHHFSWVRKNIERKIRNSSAKKNIEKWTILQDYYSKELSENPEGYFVKDFNQKLKIVENIFGI